MNKIAYPKELKSFDEQIALLKQRGMYFEDEYNRSDEDFIVSFKAKYCNRFPPSWITLEITSLGTMSILYSNLKGGRCRRQIAKYFGVADTIMVSWLHTITYVRNICAHHSRLWNKTWYNPNDAKEDYFSFCYFANQRNSARIFCSLYDSVSLEHYQSIEYFPQ